MDDFRLFAAGFRRDYRAENLRSLPRWLDCETAFEAFNRRRKGRSFALSLTLWLLPLSAVQSLGYLIGQFLLARCVLALGAMVATLRGAPPNGRAVIGNVVAFLAFSALRAYVNAHASLAISVNCTRAEAVVQLCCFEKLEKIDLEVARADSAQLSALLTSDLARISAFLCSSQQLAVGVAALALTLRSFKTRLGARGALSALVLALLSLLYLALGAVSARLLRRKLSMADARNRAFAEAVAGARWLRFAGWETAAVARVTASREAERSLARWIVFARATIEGMSIALPMLVMGALFALANLTIAAVPLESVIGLSAMLNALALPLRQLVQCAGNFLDARAALRRISAFLALPEQSDNCEFGGESDAFKALSDVARGQFIALLGETRTGKSALLRRLLSSQTRNAKSVAYVSQETFLLNATIRENVLFGLSHNAQRYEQTLSACALLADIAALPNGDKAIVGERGMRLSAGQRARVCLARALYANCDVYLIDDCLAALDDRTANEVFDRVFGETLKGKTAIVVNPPKAFLGAFDRIVKIGTETEEFVSERKAEFAFRPNSPPFELKESETSDSADDERFAKGFVSRRTYFQYLKLGGIRYASFTFALIVALIALRHKSDRFMANFVSKSPKPISGESFTTRYALFCLFGLALIVLRGASQAEYGTRIAHRALGAALQRVFRQPLQVLERTPLGRLLSITTRDVDVIELQLAVSAPSLLAQLCQLAHRLFLAVRVDARCALVAAPFVAAVGLATFAFSKSAVEMRRLAQSGAARTLATAAETLSGLSLFRAYNRLGTQRAKYVESVRLSISATFHEQRLVCPPILLLDLLAAALVAAVFVAAAVAQRAAPTYTAVALGEVAALTGAMQLLFYTLSIATQAMSSVERVFNCAPAFESIGRVAPTDWPRRGALSVRGLCARHGADRGLALCDVSFEARPGERLGVAGRSGAGKSSLVRALAQTLARESGEVLVDGVELRNLCPTEVRRALFVVPQEAFCFAGTLRENVDPTRAHSDEEVFAALLRTEMCAAADGSSPLAVCALEWRVEPNGGNLSLVQRRLICLARALLVRPRILLLDEPFADLDAPTELRMRCALFEQFADSTIVIVAHRRETLFACDRVIVIENGRIAADEIPSKIFGEFSAESED